MVALGVSAVRAQNTGAQQGSGTPGDAQKGDTRGPVRVREKEAKESERGRPLFNEGFPVDDIGRFFFMEFGFVEEIFRQNEAEADAEDEKEAREASQRLERTPPVQQAQAGGESVQSGGGESILRFKPDPKADPQFATQSALEGMADRLEEFGLKDASRALRDLARKIREAPQTAAPGPISLWIQGRPPGSGPNPGAELAFHVSQVPTFQAAGVALLSNTWSDPAAWPGAVYAELDQPRKVAPAPGLDPDGWPATGAAPLSLTLETPIP
ncbi:MAG TPA: hypothetical protein VLD61_10790 [Methylomirabilota bacterium]|nr:hypothetical protein [Methylomirabilota bacterium]